jgi:hypothetical protein
MVDDPFGILTFPLSEFLEPGPVRLRTEIWERHNYATLSTRQARAIVALRDTLNWAHDQWEIAWPFPLDAGLPCGVRKALTAYEEAMITAIREDLLPHPVVSAWVEMRRVLGEWDQLRHAKRGLERGVKRPLEQHAVALSHMIADAITAHLKCQSRLHPDCLSPRYRYHVYRALLAKKSIRMSWEAFRKFVTLHECDAFVCDMSDPPTSSK